MKMKLVLMNVYDCFHYLTLNGYLDDCNNSGIIYCRQKVLDTKIAVE